MSNHITVLSGGTIWTLDPHNPRVEALAVRNNQIIAVGDVAHVRSVVGNEYQLIDLAGRSVVPGLCDAHIHLLWSALLADQVDLANIASFDDVLSTIRAHAERLPADAWVVGAGWDHSLWGGRWPTAADLDRVTGGRPAMLRRKDLHSAWVNSAALQRANITVATPEPAGGTIGRDEHGLPNGMIYEDAQLLLTACIPEQTHNDKEQAIVKFIRRLHQHGITSVHVPEGPDCFAAVQALYARGNLSMRVLHHLRADLLDHALAMGLRSGLGDEWVRFGNLKIFADGSLGSATAHMLEPFDNLPANAPHPHGIAMYDVEDLHELVERSITNNISVIVHAIGDAANRNVLDAIESALRAYPARVLNQLQAKHGASMALLPNRIEHAQIVHPTDFARFGKLGIIASVQPIHATSDMDVSDQLWGARSANAYAWRTLQQNGAILAFGSDAPVDSWNPWHGIHAAVTRQRPQSDKPAWYPEQQLSLEEALWGYTVGAAITSGELAIKGSLSVGKRADLVVLDRDLLETADHDLHAVQTDMTMLDGEVVWER